MDEVSGELTAANTAAVVADVKDVLVSGQDVISTLESACS
jgi:hypothetical protein